MNTPEVKGGVVAYLNVDGAMKAAEFYRRALGAEIIAAHPTDDKGRTTPCISTSTAAR
jgi:PhnB protein